MYAHFRTATLFLILLTFVTGVIYPVIITLIAQQCFPYEANGSLLYRDQQLVGSELIGQPFGQPRYFWSRPSSTGPFPYNANSSSGSNFGPQHPELAKSIESRIAALQTSGTTTTNIPIDLVTSSGSGLDPHISPAAAHCQVGRIAHTRHCEESVLQQLVVEHTEARQWGLFGEPRVNVLRLNLALDQLSLEQ